VTFESVRTSCGLGVSFYEFQEERTQLISWATEKGEEKLQEYWQMKNKKSIDGLPTKLLED
jgi:hypothetical protein